MKRKLLIDWIVLAAIYLAFAGTASTSEIVAATLTGLVCAVSLRAIRAQVPAHFELEPRWIGLLARKVPVRALKDCFLVLVVLLRSVLRHEPLHGALITVPFDPGGDDASSAARRALVATAITVSPDSIVVRIERDRGHLLIHQLSRTPSPPGEGNTRWPV